MSENFVQRSKNDMPGYQEIMDGLVGYHLRRAQQAAFQHFLDSLSEWRITPAQLTMLAMISDNPGISQTTLAKAMGVQRATLGEMIDRLEAQDLLERGRVPRDRRSYALKLTKQGAEYLAKIFPLVLEQEDSFTHHLTVQERQQLIGLLKRLRY